MKHRHLYRFVHRNSRNEFVWVCNCWRMCRRDAATFG